MKAIQIHQFGGPEVLRFEETPIPPLGPGQVRLQVKAVGVNPVDTYIRNGIYGPRPFPFIPGMDAAGVIDSIGAGVTNVKKGERVYAFAVGLGAYAEQIVTEAVNVHPLPGNLSFAQGAALGVPYGTAYYGLFTRGQAHAGETVLIHGASGGVGTAAVQLGRLKGLHVIGTGGTEKGRALVLKEGAHEVLDHTSADYLDQLMKLTGNKGVDLILEMLANVNLGKDLKVLAKRGRVIVVGSRGKVEIDPRDTMGRLADIRGLALLALTPEEIAGVHAGLAEPLASGALKPVVGREFPLAEAAKAHEAVMAPGAHGKIVLIP